MTCTTSARGEGVGQTQRQSKLAGATDGAGGKASEIKDGGGGALHHQADSEKQRAAPEARYKAAMSKTLHT